MPPDILASEVPAALEEFLRRSDRFAAEYWKRIDEITSLVSSTGIEPETPEGKRLIAQVAEQISDLNTFARDFDETQPAANPSGQGSGPPVAREGLGAGASGG